MLSKQRGEPVLQNLVRVLESVCKRIKSRVCPRFLARDAMMIYHAKRLPAQLS